MSAVDSERTTVGALMHSGVITCRPEASLRKVAAILAAHRIHAVVVASDDERAPLAVVTDRDVIWAHAHGKLDRMTAREAATEPTVTVRAGAQLRQVTELMAHYGTGHVVVTESGGGRAIGIVSSLDVADAVG
jgi:CBS domain-containing protein